jgi:hypothetical protein
MGREFPYTPQGMAEAEQYRQAVGMRGGGMMGFRPVGYQTGGVIDRDDSFAEGEAFDQATREAIIENIMNLTKGTSAEINNPTILFDLSDEQLMAAQQNLMAEAAAANAPPPAYPPGVREMLGAATERQAATFAGLPEDQGFITGPLGEFAGKIGVPFMEDMPVGRNRGGIMSLRGY